MRRNNNNNENPAMDDTYYINNLEELSEKIRDNLKTIDLHAGTNAYAVTDITTDGMTVTRHPNMAEANPPAGYSVPEAMWNVLLLADANGTLEDMSDEKQLYADHVGCNNAECRTVVHDPDHDTTTCPDCDNDMKTLVIPKELTLEKFVPFPDTTTPVESDQDLERALQQLFDDPSIDLSN